MNNQKGYGIMTIRSDDNMARKTHTSTEVKNRWNEKTYRRYQTFFRYDTDKDLIDWIEAHKKELGTSNIFREAMEKYIAEYDED